MKPALAGFFVLISDTALRWLRSLPHLHIAAISQRNGETLSMDTVLTREEVLKLFREEADRLDKKYIRQDDTIAQFAQLLAEAKTMLPEKNFADLVKIGAILYKANHSRKRARAEIATTMRESIDNGNGAATE